ncbi:MAG: DUF3014 domain-containing protein [Parashewanella sp.]
MQANQEDRIVTSDGNKSGGVFALIAFVLAIIAVAGYFYFSQPQPVQPEPISETVTIPEALPEKPLPTENIPEPEPEPLPVEPEPTPEPIAETTQTKPAEPKAEPLPSLEQSDGFLHQQALTALKGISINNLLVNKNIARQFVVFVDNLAHGAVARKASPLFGPKQEFSVLEVENKIYLDPDSYHRYDLYADLLATLNKQALVTTYTKVLPILDNAFSELGYEGTRFNRRLKQAIKEMLDAPILEHPLELTSISVNYRFKNKNLESLPDAQKLMIRMGPENTKKVKIALKEIYNMLPR